MNETVVIILTIVLFSYSAWLMKKFNNSYGPSYMRKIPELERFSEKEQRKIWLETIFSVLLHWQTIIVVTLVSVVAACIYVKLGEIVQSPWNKAFGIALVTCPILLLRPLLIRRARSVLSERTKKT